MEPEEITVLKKKKRSRKDKEQAPIETNNEVVADTDVQVEHAEVSEKRKKKKKKEKAVVEEPQEEAQEVIKTKTSKPKSGDRDYYDEHEDLASFTASEVNEYRKKLNMTVSYMDNSNPKDVFESEPVEYQDSESSSFRDLKPIRLFSELVLPDARLLESTKNFKTPTAIQSQCWPFLLSGKDVIGIAETGSGKTLAFSIPAFVHLRNIDIKKKGGPYVLIVAPTRELAIQIFEVCESLGKSTNIRCACFYGGVEKQGQYNSLERGVHVLVATPGRLLDLMQEGALTLENVSFAVLDEADRMLDKGFERDIKTILSKTKQDRQTIMFSATWPQSIRNLAITFLKNPIRVTIGSAELAANQKITQYVEVIETEREKDQKLLSLLKDYHKSKKNRILIFVLYKREAPKIEGLLKRQGYKVAAIHGDMSQAQRIAALQSFKDATNPLLVATDVAARGLDIPDVEYVINYSFPLTIEDYVHRIGRTGRAGKTGVSFTMFTTNDKLRAAELVAILKEANAEVPPALLKLSSYGTKKQEHALYGAHAKDFGSKPMPKSSHVKFDD